MKLLKIKNTIEKIGIEYQIKEPFYGSIFRRLKKVYTYEVNTIGLRFGDRIIELCINPYYIKKLSHKEAKAVCEHILLHICFKHIIKANRADRFDREIYNIAAELEVNQRVENIPAGAISIEDIFTENVEAIEKKREAEYYYPLLLNSITPGYYGTLDSHDFWRVNYALNNLMRHEDISPEGLLPDEDEAGANQQSLNEFDDISEEKFDPGKLLGSDKETDDLCLSEQDISIEELLKKAEEEAEGDLPGNLPADLIRKIHLEEEEIAYKPEWSHLLREYLNQLLYKSSFTQYELKRSKRRPNKKIGFPFPSIKVDPLPKLNIAVCIDGSGSINYHTFQEFMQEINCLYDREMEISLIGFDFEVKEENIIRNYNPFQLINTKKIEDLFPGELGGGTDFVPAVEVSVNLKPKPDCIVMFTDSNDDGNLEPPAIPIIFILSQQREDFYDWAKCVKMYDEDEEDTVYLFSSRPDRS